jgi:hypothetical protein
MTERTSTDILVEDLQAAKAPQFMLRKARDGQYNDYLSESPHPIIDLVRDATIWNLRQIAEQARAGKYDGTRAESEAWFQREGRDMLGGEPHA